MRVKRPLRLIGLVLGGILLALVVVVAGALFTSFGRHTLVGIGLDLAARAGYPVRIASLDWPSLGHLEVAGVEVDDPQGTWLTVDRAVLDWRPRDLLSRTLAVDLLDVGTVDLPRAPAYPPSPTPTESSGAPLPLPVALDIRSVRLGKLDIGAAVAGEAASVAATAELRVPREIAAGATAHIDAEVSGRAPASARIDVVYKPGDDTLEADVALTAAPGGLIHALAGLPPEDALSVRFDGTGPIGDWSSTLAATLGGRDLASGAVRITRQAAAYDLTADLAATAVAAALLPPDIVPIVGDAPKLALAATIGDDGSIAVTSFTADAAGASAQGNATVAGDGALSGEATLALAGSGPFAALLDGMAEWTGGTAHLVLGGTRDAPSARLSAAIEAPRTEALAADHLIVEASVEPAPSLVSSGGHRITADASMSGVTVAGTTLPVDETPRLEIAAVVDEAGNATIETARLTALSAVVNVTGEAGPTEVDVATTTEIGDLSRLGALVGQQLAGALNLEASVAGDPSTSTFSTRFDLASSGIRTGIEIVDRLVGEAPTASGAIDLAAGSLAVRSLEIEAAQLSATASGTLAADAAGIDVTAKMADLSAVDPTLQGAGELGAHIAGALPNPTVTFRIESPDLTAAAIALGAVEVAGTLDLAETAAAPAGTTRATLAADVTAAGGGPMRLAGDAAFVAAGPTVDLKLDLASPTGGTAQKLAALFGVAIDEDLDLAVTASGPLDGLAGTVVAKLAGQDLLTADVGMAALGTGQRLTLSGSAVPATVPVAFLPENLRPIAGEKVDIAATVVLDPGITRIESATVNAAAANLTASGTLDGGGGLDITAEATLAGSAPFAALLNDAATWTGGTLRAEIGGSLASPSVRFQAGLDGVAAADATLASVTATGTVARHEDGTLDADVEVKPTGLVLAGQQVPDEPQPSITASVTVAPDGTVAIRSARLGAYGSALTATGTARPDAIDLDTRLVATDLSPLGAALGHPLGGALDVTAQVTGNPSAMEFAATVALSASGLDTGIPEANAAVGPTPRLAGKLAYAGERITVDGLTFDGGAVSLRADGTVAQDAAGLDVTATLRDLAALAPNLAGSATVTARIAGAPTAPEIAFRAASDRITAAGQVLAPFAAEGRLDLSKPGAIAAGVTLSGTSAGRPITGEIAFTQTADGRSVEVKNLSFVGLSGNGALAQKGVAPPTGTLHLQATDVAPLAALAGVAASGGFKASIELPEDKAQPAHVTLSSPRLTALGNTIESLDVAMDVTDPLGRPHFAATVRAARIAASGQTVERLELRADGPLSAVAVTASARVNAMPTSITATVDAAGPRITTTIARAEIGTGNASVRLARQSTVAYADGGARVDLGLTTGAGGRVDVRGTASATALGLNIELDRLPLALARIAVPDLPYVGTIGGRINLRGSPAAPRGSYNISLAGFRDTNWPANVPTVTASFAGDLAATSTSVRARIEAGSLARLTIDGTAPLSPTGRIDLAVRGPVDLDLLQAIALPPTTDITGRLALDIRVGGTAAAPTATGTVNLGSISVEDHARDISANRIRGEVRLAGRTVNLVGISGNFGGGGRLEASGSVTLDPAAGFPGNLTLTARQVVVNQGDGLARGAVDADIKMTGPLARSPTIGGKVTLVRMDLNIAERLPSTAETIDVRHINVPARLAQYFPAPEDPNAARGPGFEARLDISVEAANQINVRGLGLNAEFRGSFRISGTTNAPIVLGGLDLRRGTFDILNQRLTFSRGNIRFVDDFDPELDLVAETRAGTVTAYVTVTGTGSNPRIEFSSSPTLPQDEVVSYILFRKATATLSATEAIMLADAVASLSGGGSSGLLDQIRKTLGLNRLGVTGDGAGGTTVEAGGYAAQNVYVGVQQGTTAASTQVQVTVDVTDEINVNANVGADGSSSLGLGVEWDY